MIWFTIFLIRPRNEDAQQTFDAEVENASSVRSQIQEAFTSVHSAALRVLIPNATSVHSAAELRVLTQNIPGLTSNPDPTSIVNPRNRIDRAVDSHLAANPRMAVSARWV